MNKRISRQCCAFFLLLSFSLGQLPTAGLRAQELPLKLTQIERLLDIKFEDQLLAREIKRRGLAFQVDESLVERLLKRGLQALSQQVLLEIAEQQAFDSFNAAQPEPVKQVSLGKSYLVRFPQTARAAQVKRQVVELEIKLFTASYEAFHQTPESAKLAVLLSTGQHLLLDAPNQESAQFIITRLALTAAQATQAGFFQNLEQSQTWAKQAITVLEGKLSVSDGTPILANQLRQELAFLYRAQALYLLRQDEREADQALLLLDKAVRTDPSTIGNDALTFWLQAVARESDYQRQLKDLSRIDNSTTEKQIVCTRLEGVRTKLVEAYTRVVALATDPKSRSLQEEASLALKKLLNTNTPCLTTVADKNSSVVLPIAPNQRARKVKSESAQWHTLCIRSKTLYLKPNQLEAALLKHPDFQAGHWRILRNEREADYRIDISLPFMTWNWTYEITQTASTALVATGKIREATAGLATPKLASAIIVDLTLARESLRTEERRP